MQLRPTLIAALAVTLAGANACDSNVERDRESSRSVPKVTAEKSEASSGPTQDSGPVQAPQRSGDASTRGEKIEEAHRTSPEDNSKTEDKDVASKTRK